MADIQWWLMKSEPLAYSISHLKQEKTTLWDGIRNYQARNFMRSMQIGDKAFFYHSNCKPPGIVGLMEVIETCLVDPTQFNPKEKYYDSKSTKENPRWDCVKLKYLGKFKEMLTLDQIRINYNGSDLKLLQKGNRLSIIPIEQTIAQSMLVQLGNLHQ